MLLQVSWNPNHKKILDALAPAFLHKHLSSGIIKLVGYARENLEVIKQICNAGTKFSTVANEKFIFSTHSTERI